MRSVLMVLAAAAVVTATAGAGSLKGGGGIASAAALPLGQQVAGRGAPPSSGPTHRYYSEFWRAQPGVPSSIAAPQVDFDFNGDGLSDNAVGVPFEDVGSGP